MAEARVETYPDYDSYPARTSHDIPVVFLRGRLRARPLRPDGVKLGPD